MRHYVYRNVYLSVVQVKFVDLFNIFIYLSSLVLLTSSFEACISGLALLMSYSFHSLSKCSNYLLNLAWKHLINTNDPIIGSIISTSIKNISQEATSFGQYVNKNKVFICW